MTLDIYTLLVAMVAIAMLIAVLAITISWILFRRFRSDQDRIAALESEKRALQADIAAHAAVLHEFYPNELAQAKARAQALLGRAG